MIDLEDSLKILPKSGSMILALFQVCQLVNNGAGQEAFFFLSSVFFLLIALFLHVPQNCRFK